MRAVVYTETGGPEVLRLIDRPVPEPVAGEVRVRLRVAGVNPTDWKFRSGPAPAFPEVCPGQDGAGEVDALGTGVSGLQVGQRVWVWLAGWQLERGGTAQEYAALPAERVVPLPDSADFDLGADLGVPALTAHRCLTVAEGGPTQLAPGALAGRSVLVAGGAGAVGHSTIELARWAGARVLTTVSSPEKAALARAAGADEVIDYRAEDAATRIRELVPAGVDQIVEVAPAANAELNAAVLAPAGTIAVYANDADAVSLPIRTHMMINARVQFEMLYTIPESAKRAAVAGVSAAVADGALRVGDEAGLPVHRFPLARLAEAHAAVESGAVGKVLVDL